MAASCAAIQQRVAEARVVSPALLCGPLRQEVVDVVSDRAVLVGDAAGFLDPITGEGISIGLISARVAADVLAASLRTGLVSADALRPYAEQRAAAIRDALRLTGLVLWWVRRPMLRRYVVENLARNPDLFQTMLGVIAGATSVREVGWRDLRRLALRY